MKTNILGLLLGLLLGHFLVSGVAVYAQSAPKITISGNFALCVDVTVRDVPINISIDNGPFVVAQGVTWQVTNNIFTAVIPHSSFPSAGKTTGLHTARITTSTGDIILADGTVLSSGVLSHQYEVVAESTPAPTNPRWIRITTTIAAILASIWLALT